MGGCRVFDGDAPRLDANGRSEVRACFFPARHAEVIDTWTSTGLRGTGSHDFAVDDLFLPAERCVSLIGPAPRHGPLLAFPQIFRVMHAAHALGIAQAALDDLIELAGGKVPTWSTTRNLLRARSMVQARVGQAETWIGSARAYIHAATRDIWQTVLAGAEVSARQRATFCLAVTNALTASVQAVDLIYNTGGATSIYATSRLDRCLRDIHTTAQHVAVAPQNLESSGRLLLGLDSGNPFYP
jgi:alkylation response protein AidB-like acyl-CoA dehydrogenase